MRLLGLDVGGSNLKAAVVEGTRVVHTETHRLPISGAIGSALELGSALARRHEVAGAGIGLAGLVRASEGVFAYGPHLEGKAVAVRETFTRMIERPVVVDNDANMAAIAELGVGVARGVANGLLIALGTGIGAALIVDGRVHRGQAFAGEPGHVIARPGGESCACGRSGCWETVVSGSSLDRQARHLARSMPQGAVAAAAAGSAVTAAHLAEAADRGDTAAIDALSAAGANLGRLIADLAAILDPEVVVVGGGVAASARWLEGPAREACSTHLHGAAYREPVDIRFSKLAGDAGAIGAALAARGAVGG